MPAPNTPRAEPEERTTPWPDVGTTGIFLYGLLRLAILTPEAVHLGRALGHFIFSLIGLKRILFTNIFQQL